MLKKQTTTTTAHVPLSGIFFLTLTFELSSSFPEVPRQQIAQTKEAFEENDRGCVRPLATVGKRYESNQLQQIQIIEQYNSISPVPRTRQCRKQALLPQGKVLRTCLTTAVDLGRSST